MVEQCDKQLILHGSHSLHALEGAKNGGFFTIGIADPENAPVWKEICATATVHIHDILEMKQFF